MWNLNFRLLTIVSLCLILNSFNVNGMPDISTAGSGLASFTSNFGRLSQALTSLRPSSRSASPDLTPSISSSLNLSPPPPSFGSRSKKWNEQAILVSAPTESDNLDIISYGREKLDDSDKLAMSNHESNVSPFWEEANVTIESGLDKEIELQNLEEKNDNADKGWKKVNKDKKLLKRNKFQFDGAESKEKELIKKKGKHSFEQDENGTEIRFTIEPESILYGTEPPSNTDLIKHSKKLHPIGPIRSVPVSNTIIDETSKFNKGNDSDGYLHHNNLHNHPDNYSKNRLHQNLQMLAHPSGHKIPLHHKSRHVKNHDKFEPEIRHDHSKDDENLQFKPIIDDNYSDYDQTNVDKIPIVINDRVREKNEPLKEWFHHNHDHNEWENENSMSQSKWNRYSETYLPFE